MSAGILLIEDERVFADNVSRYLGKHGYRVRVANTGARGLKEFSRFSPDLVLLDYRLGSMDGLDVLSAIHQEDEAAKIILMTGHGSIDVAVRAMKAGACDFLTKPVSLDRIKRIVDRIVTEREDGLPRGDEPVSPAQDDVLLGDSPPMHALRTRITQITGAKEALSGNTPPTTLIHGETGTGKELVAAALHALSPRRGKAFVSVNCAAIPAHLVEAELFGFERGAFTDAKAAKPGLFETADGGVLFLDEIGDLDLSVQGKLLRVLEQRAVRRIGSVTDKPVNAWVISATNRSLEDLVAEEAFRADLLFRLNLLTIETPRLKDLGDDVMLLTDHFVSRLANSWNRPALRLGADVRAKLQDHHWPGNVRELRNVIEQAVLLTQNDVIRARDIDMGGPTSAETNPSTVGEFLLPPEGFDLEEIELDFLRQALERSDWNISAAARLLSLTRDTLRYRMEKFGLSRPIN